MAYKDPEKQKEARKKYEEKRKKKNGERHKVWTLIFYPDSAPEYWEDLISDLHLKVWVSPLQDRDTWTSADENKNPDHKSGTVKKPHYHLVVQYEDVQQDREAFLKDFGFLNGPTSVKAVKSLRSMVRYLCHLDNPEKAQYDPDLILCFGGADFDIVQQLGTHERYECLRAMRKFIRDNEIIDFCRFVDYCDEYEQVWAGLLDDNSSYVIEKYIKSYRYAVLADREEKLKKSLKKP